MSAPDSIVATATPNGESALAIIRVSGPLVPAILQSALRLPDPSPRTATLTSYHDLKDQPLDHLIATWFKAPHSFTGEHVLELTPHGNPFLIRKILDDLHQRGCRFAAPGEFSKRAFLNGRIDLTQAEAIADFIRARSDRALAAARRQLDGSVSLQVQQLSEHLITLTAQLEAYIDFPEEDLPTEDPQGPLNSLKQLVDRLNQLIATRSYSSLLHDGVKCVIVGEPNVGKSSLLNALLGENRAIVSAEPGTTRDYLEDRLLVGPYLLRVVDTAGLHATVSPIEREGISRSLQQLQAADLILVVLDATRSSPTLTAFLPEHLPADRVIVVTNKIDLAAASPTHLFPEAPRVAVSALYGTGLDALRDQIIRSIEQAHSVPDADAVIVSARHADALAQVRCACLEACQLLQQQQPAELAATHLHIALDHLGDITGRIDNEQVLDALFHSFCIGK